MDGCLLFPPKKMFKKRSRGHEGLETYTLIKIYGNIIFLFYSAAARDLFGNVLFNYINAELRGRLYT
jgi:hypothetical protein